MRERRTLDDTPHPPLARSTFPLKKRAGGAPEDEQPKTVEDSNINPEENLKLFIKRVRDYLRGELKKDPGLAELISTYRNKKGEAEVSQIIYVEEQAKSHDDKKVYKLYEQSLRAYEAYKVARAEMKSYVKERELMINALSIDSGLQARVCRTTRDQVQNIHFVAMVREGTIMIMPR